MPARDPLRPRPHGSAHARARTARLGSLRVEVGAARAPALLRSAGLAVGVGAVKVRGLEPQRQPPRLRVHRQHARAHACANNRALS